MIVVVSGLAKHFKTGSANIRQVVSVILDFASLLRQASVIFTEARLFGAVLVHGLHTSHESATIGPLRTIIHGRTL